jgi:hypothetical protein
MEPERSVEIAAAGDGLSKTRACEKNCDYREPMRQGFRFLGRRILSSADSKAFLWWLVGG